MPSQAFLAAAKKADRQPVGLMAVESISALKATSETISDWQAAKSSSNLNLITEPNTGFLATDTAPWVRAGTYNDGPQVGAGDQSIEIVKGETTPVSGSNAHVVRAVFNITIILPHGIPLKVQGNRNNTGWVDLLTIAPPPSTTTVTADYDISLTEGSWQFKLVVETSSFAKYYLNHFTTYYVVRYLATGSIQTKTLDLGAIPTQSSHIEIKDATPAGCGISYTARGSNDGATWTSLGTVKDADSLAPYRYYDVTATLTSDGTDTPILTYIWIIGGDSQYDYYSTRKNIPVQGAKPYIIEGSVSSQPSKIELMGAASTGELSLKLAWTKKTSDMLATGYLKNKAVTYKLGFVGLAESDFESYFTGTWFDHQDDHEKMEINVKTRDTWKQFKTKFPAAEYFASLTQVSAGMVSVVNGSSIVIGSGTSFLTRAHVGDTFQVSGDGALYAIAVIDSDTTLHLTSNFAGLTNPAISAVISRVITPNAVPTLYTTGTVTVTHNANIVQGVGTAFIANVKAGDTFRLTNYADTYEVTGVVSDTILNIDRIYAGATLSNATFQITDNSTATSSSKATKTLSGNIIDVMLQIVDGIDVPDRYINRPTFLALKAAHYNTADWNVYRKLTQPEDADKLLIELAVSAGLFLPVLADGRITPVHYDTMVTGAPADTLDARKYSFKPIDGGQKELFTVQAIYYQMLPGKTGGSKEDYFRASVFTNATAETNWQESYTKEWLDKWRLPAAAIERLGQRMDSWYANPRSTVRVEGLPPKYMDLDRGKKIAVDWLRLPAPAADWPGYSDGKEFLIMSRGINPTDYTVSLDLFEIGPTNYQTGALPAYPTWGVYPPVTALTLTEKLALTSTYSVDYVVEVTFTQPTDFHFGGAQVWYKKGADAWAYHGKVDFGGPDTTRTYRIAAELATAYQVAVLTINSAGLVMPLASAPTATITTATTPPAPLAPISLTATGALRAVKLVVNYPFSKWLDTIEIHRSITNDRSTATPAVPASGPLSIDPNLTAGQTYYYWAKVRDIFDQYSTWYPASATAGVAATVQSETDITNPLDVQNLIKKTTFNDLSLGTWNGSGAIIDSESPTSTGNTGYLQVSNRDTIELNNRFPVYSGESIYAEALLQTLHCNYNMNIGLQLRNKDLQVVNWIPIAVRPPNSAWAKCSGGITIPAGVAWAEAWIQIDMPPGTPNNWGKATELKISRFQPGATVGASWGVNIPNVDTAYINPNAVTTLASTTTDVSANVLAMDTYGATLNSPSVDASAGKVEVSVSINILSTGPALVGFTVYRDWTSGGGGVPISGSEVDINVPAGRTQFAYTWQDSMPSGAHYYTVSVISINTGVSLPKRTITIAGMKR